MQSDWKGRGLTHSASKESSVADIPMRSRKLRTKSSTTSCRVTVSPGRGPSSALAPRDPSVASGSFARPRDRSAASRSSDNKSSSSSPSLRGSRAPAVRAGERKVGRFGPLPAGARGAKISRERERHLSISTSSYWKSSSLVSTKTSSIRSSLAMAPTTVHPLAAPAPSIERKLASSAC